MNTIQKNSVVAVVELLALGSRKATKYISPTEVIKGTCRHRPRRGQRSVEIVLTIGKPNWGERQFIAAAKKAEEPFPIRRVQLKPWGKP